MLHSCCNTITLYLARPWRAACQGSARTAAPLPSGAGRLAMAQLALQEALRGYGLAAAAEGQALVPGSRARRDAIEGLITRLI